MNPTDPFGLAGQVLDGQFRVERLVGEGGFSAVYRGHNLGLNEPVAVKCLKVPPGVDSELLDTFLRRFQDESRILYRLSQGNLSIVRSISAGATQSSSTGMTLPYMILEWLEGRSVANDFTVRRTLGMKGRAMGEIMSLFASAADALAYAHGQGVIHRDLNPGNLFFAQTPQGVRMKVLDFGVAKIMDDSTLGLGARAQTMGQFRIFAPAYGAPEQFDESLGAAGPWSDVYAFALILLEALRDKSVNEGTNLVDFAQRALDPKVRATPRALGIAISDELEAVFERATALEPRRRYASAGELWQALTAATQRPATAGATARPPPSDPMLRTVPFGSNAAPQRPHAMLRATVQGLAPPGLAAPPQPPRVGSSPGMSAVKGPSSIPPRPTPPSQRPKPPEAPQAAAPEAATRRVDTMDTQPPPAFTPPPSALYDDDDVDDNEVTRVRAPEPDMLARTMAMGAPIPAAGKRPEPARPEPPPHDRRDRPSSGTLIMAPGAMGPAIPVAPPTPKPPSFAPPPAPSPRPDLQQEPPPAPMMPAGGYVQNAGYGPPPAQVPPATMAMQGAPPMPGAQSALVPPQATEAQAQAAGPASIVPGPPSFAPSLDAKPSKTPLIVVSVVLGLLLVSGLTLGFLALRARGAGAGAELDAAASASAPSASESVVAAPPPPPSASVAPPEPPPAVETDAAVAEIDEPVDAAAEAAVTTAPAPNGSAPTYTWTAPPASASAKPEEPGWNAATARAKLQSMNSVLLICKKDGAVSGPGSATVTFAPEGNVTSVALDPPYAGTKEGDCAAGQFRRAKVNAFPGASQTVRHSFEVPK